MRVKSYRIGAGESGEWVYVTAKYNGRFIFMHVYPRSVWRRIAPYVMTEVAALQALERGVNPAKLPTYASAKAACERNEANKAAYEQAAESAKR